MKDEKSACKPTFLTSFTFFAYLPVLLFCLDGFLIAVSAEWFVLLGLSQQHALVVLYGTVTDIGQRATLHADGMDLGDVVGNGAERRHGAEGLSPEVHVQSGNDDAHPAVGQFVTDADQTLVEELGFVDTYHVDVGTEQQDAGRRVEWGGVDGVVVVAHHLLVAVAGVDGRLEDFYLLLGKLRTAQTADEFFGLSREHGTADNFYSSGATALAR